MIEFARDRAQSTAGCSSDGCPSSSGLRARAKRWLVAQFRRPAGFWGHVAGWIMARRSSNVERTQWTVDLLEIAPADRVLEIGFGPGVGIAAANRFSTTGLVEGIDHSEVMLRQASKRNRSAIRSGHVRLQLGSVTDIPIPERPYQKIFAVNCAKFWPEPVACLLRLRELLTPGGVLAITEQPRLHHDGKTGVLRASEQLVSQFQEAGFRQVSADFKQLKDGLAVCVRGVNRTVAEA